MSGSPTAKTPFTVAPADRSERGTAVVLHVRDDQREFLEPWRLRQLVERYSDYVSHPIQLRVTKGTGDQARTDFETINRASALWQRPKSDITEEQYDEFYRHLAHGDGVKPVARAHFKNRGNAGVYRPSLHSEGASAPSPIWDETPRTAPLRQARPRR